MASCLTRGLSQSPEPETLKLFVALNCFLSRIESWIKASGTFRDDSPFHRYVLSCDRSILMRAYRTWKFCQHLLGLIFWLLCVKNKKKSFK